MLAKQHQQQKPALFTPPVTAPTASKEHAFTNPKKKKEEEGGDDAGNEGTATTRIRKREEIKTQDVKQVKQEENQPAPPSPPPPTNTNTIKQEVKIEKEVKVKVEDQQQQQKPSNNNDNNVKLLAQCTIVLSGYQNPLRGQIRDMAIKLGAKVAPDWGPGCTHLIAAFDNTPKFTSVMSSGFGWVVSKDWLQDCELLSKKVDERKYLIGSGGPFAGQ